MSERGEIELVSADAARVSMSAVVPYGWQGADEDVWMPSTPGGGIHCFALLTRTNHCRFATTRHSITSQFVLEQVEHFSMGLRKLTVLVWDNAPVHTAKLIQARRVGGAGAVCVVPTALRTARAYCGNAMAQAQIRVAGTHRLRNNGGAVLHRPASTCRSRNTFMDQFFKV